MTSAFGRMRQGVHAASAFKHRLTNRWERRRTPITPRDLRAALGKAVGSGTEILLVHASFSGCGHFTGGAGDVLTGLGEVCETLLLPTNSYCYPASTSEPGPLFDPAVTPSVVGRLSDEFRTGPGVIRSIHATHSIAARGPRAEELCADHYRQSTPCGAGTPYDRLLATRASVLMFGLGFEFYTLFHTAEDASGSPYAYEPNTIYEFRVLDEEGREQRCRSRRHFRGPTRYEEAGRLLIRAGLARSVALGRSQLLYVPDCARVHDFIVERLRTIPDLLRPSCTAPLEWQA